MSTSVVVIDTYEDRDNDSRRGHKVVEDEWRGVIECKGRLTVNLHTKIRISVKSFLVIIYFIFIFFIFFF